MIAIHGVWTKHLCQERIGFNPVDLSFTSLGLINFIILICAIPYWSQNGFQQSQFWIGLGGSLLSSIGLAALMKALAVGPIGPVLAVGDGYPPILAVIVAFKNHKMISKMELIALILGILGVLIMVLHQ